MPGGVTDVGGGGVVVGALSLSPGLGEAAHFPHPGAGHSPHPPPQLHPLLPDPQGNLEEHSSACVTHNFMQFHTQADKAEDGDFLPLAMEVL